MFILESALIKRVSKIIFVPIVLLSIESCSQEPIGEELSNSFDSPIEEKPKENSISGKINSLAQVKVNEKENNRTLEAKKNNEKIEKQITFSNNRSKNQFKSKEKLSPFNPQPYRITIKLSAADPSAPAETVTKALRLAGVRFEVEMIELIENQSSIKEMRSGRSNR